MAAAAPDALAADVAEPCREEKCKKIAVHGAHPWDFYRMPKGAWVPCPRCRGQEASCGACGELRMVPRHRAFEILKELKEAAK